MNYPWFMDLRTGFGYFISVHLAKIATYNFWGTKSKVIRFCSFWYQMIPIVSQACLPNITSLSLLSPEQSPPEIPGFSAKTQIFR